MEVLAPWLMPRPSKEKEELGQAGVLFGPLSSPLLPLMTTPMFAKRGCTAAAAVLAVAGSDGGSSGSSSSVEALLASGLGIGSASVDFWLLVATLDL